MRRRVPKPCPGMSTPAGGPAERATVIIGIDAASVSWGAFRWGCGEARRLGGRAIAAIVGSSAALMTGLCAATSLTLEDHPNPGVTISSQAQDLIAEMRREAPGLDLAVVCSPGNPVTELLRIGEEVRADLIVVGGTIATPRRFAGLVGHGMAARRRRPVIVAVPPEHG